MVARLNSHLFHSVDFEMLVRVRPFPLSHSSNESNAHWRLFLLKYSHENLGLFYFIKYPNSKHCGRGKDRSHKAQNCWRYIKSNGGRLLKTAQQKFQKSTQKNVLKIGINSAKVYTKNVPNVEVCDLTPAPPTTQSIKAVTFCYYV